MKIESASHMIHAVCSGNCSGSSSSSNDDGDGGGGGNSSSEQLNVKCLLSAAVSSAILRIVEINSSACGLSAMTIKSEAMCRESATSWKTTDHNYVLQLSLVATLSRFPLPVVRLVSVGHRLALLCRRAKFAAMAGAGRISIQLSLHNILQLIIQNVIYIYGQSKCCQANCNLSK